MKVTARLAPMLMLGCLTTCRPAAPPAAGDAAAATLPALLRQVPADAMGVAHTADLPALLGGMSQYAKALLTGTKWDPSSKRSEWQDKWGFDPLQADSYAAVGIEVTTGALVMMLDPNASPIGLLGVHDPNLLDAALERIGTVKGQPPQRETRTVAGRPALGWVAANEEASTLYRVYVDQYVLLARDLSQIEKLLSRPAGAPSLADDPNALRAWQKSAPGNLDVWSRHQATRWSVTSLRLGSTGFAAEALMPIMGGAAPGTLAALLQRLDPAALMAVVVTKPAEASVDKEAWALDANQQKTVDDMLTRTTGLTVADLMNVFAGEATAELLWESDASSSVPLFAMASRVQGTATLQVKDNAAAAALLERTRAYMAAHPDGGVTLEPNSVRVGQEGVPVYWIKTAPATTVPAAKEPAPAPSPAPPGKKKDGRRSWMQPARPGPPMRGGHNPLAHGPQLGRVAVWHGHLIFAWGDQALEHALGIAQGRDNHWLTSNQAGIVGKHVEGRSSLFVLRFGRVAELMAGEANNPAVPMLRDLTTVLRRLGDLVISSRMTAEGTQVEYEQRFPVETAQTL